jgi:hypothetical protein
MSNFQFSHVFEDSSIEEDILSNVQHDARVLMIASGGCTLMKLAQLYPNMKIDVVDYNINQIHLTVFKLLLSDYTENYKDIVYKCKAFEYYGIEPDGTCDYKKLLDSMLDKYSYLDYSKYLNYWYDHIDLLESGIGFIGKLEKKFKLILQKNLDFKSFEINFNIDMLAQEFGEDSVKLTSEGFVNHFYNVMQKFEHDNEFHHLIKYGIPNDESLKKIMGKKNLNNITFYNTDMINFNNGYKYDLIQLSNIADWIKTEDNIKSLLNNCINILKNTGSILLRQLNGDYNIANLLNKDLYIKNINYIDKTYFYKNIFVIKRKMKDCAKLSKLESVAFIKEIIQKEDIYENKYINSLINNSMSLEQFYSTQKIFHHAVNNWISVLIKFLFILSEKDRIILLDNVNDELGNGDQTKAHSNTFQNFLNSVLEKINPEQKNNCNLECVDIFVSNLYSILDEKSITYVAAYLGAIEYAYIFISAAITNYVNLHNIVQYHYELHEELDTKHSNDLFNIAINNMTYDSDFYNGLKDGYKNFMKMYEDMFLNETRK